MIRGRGGGLKNSIVTLVLHATPSISSKTKESRQDLQMSRDAKEKQGLWPGVMALRALEAILGVAKKRPTRGRSGKRPSYGRIGAGAFSVSFVPGNFSRFSFTSSIFSLPLSAGTEIAMVSLFRN